jgi:hypothetical protein
VRSGQCYWNESTAWHRYVADGVNADQSGVELDNLGGRRCQDIDGARIRVRMWSLDVNDTLIFRGFGFGQMRVHDRRFTRLSVHVEKRRVKCHQKKRRYDAAGRQLSHVRHSD